MPYTTHTNKSKYTNKATTFDMLAHSNKMISFDVETTGLERKHKIWSAAFGEWGAVNEREVYMDLTEKNIAEMSDFTKPTYEKTLPKIKKTISPLELLQDINQQLDKTPLLVGHNLKFDTGQLMRYSKLNDPFIDNELIKLQKRFDPLGANISQKETDIADNLNKTLTDKEKVDISAWKKRSVYSGGTSHLIKESRYDEAWRKIQGNMQNALSSSVNGVYTKAAIVDTLTLSKIALGMASQSGTRIGRAGGYGENKYLKFGANLSVGQKLENISELLGINTAPLAHTGKDVIMNQTVLEAVIADMDTLSKGGDISHLNLRAETNAWLEFTEEMATPEGKIRGEMNTAAIVADNNLKSAILDVSYREVASAGVKDAPKPYFSTGPLGDPIGATDNISSIYEQINEKYKDALPENIENIHVEQTGYLRGLNEEELLPEVERMKKQLAQETRDLQTSVIQEKVKRFKIMKREAHVSGLTSATARESLMKSAKVGGIAIAGLILASTMLSAGTSSYEQEVTSNDDNFSGDYSPIEKLQRTQINPTDPWQTANSYKTASFFKQRSEFVSTQGIGLEMSKHMTNHYVM